jgi:phosphoribosylformimino-5-aminoimidazole carboxamide ribotide isomerase
MIEIIPAIDLIDGKCVRLTQGDYGQKKEYSDSPLDVAKRFEDAGIKRLHLVDLDGAREKRIINHQVLEKIASNTRLHIDFGGGIQSEKDIQVAFNSGAKQVTGGSVAVRNPNMFQDWLQKYGPDKIILGADARDGMIAVGGWQETTEISLFDLIGDYIRKGAIYSICTDVAKDGLLQGPSVDLYKEILMKYPKLKLIASGGVSQISDLDELKEIGCYGVIIGKAFYEGRITLEQLKAYL